MDNIKQILSEGIEFLEIDNDSHKLELLAQFILLIEKWNKAYNLTAIRDKQDMARLHILDSLAILPHLHGQRFVDVGTGAGLPAIPLAIYQPNQEFVLIDSNAKKTRFVQQAILELNLKNVSVWHTRVENYQPERLFDTVLCRAFANLPDILKLTRHLLTAEGLLLAMKGQIPEEELLQLQQAYEVIELTIPQVAARRCVVCVRR